MVFGTVLIEEIKRIIGVHFRGSKSIYRIFTSLVLVIYITPLRASPEKLLLKRRLLQLGPILIPADSLIIITRTQETIKARVTESFVNEETLLEYFQAFAEAFVRNPADHERR